MEGTIEKPIPAAVRIPGTTTYTIGLPLAAIRVNRSSPMVIMVRPLPSTARTPKRLDEPPALRATTMIVRAMGRKHSPASSGERPRTCWRYRELRNHIGNSAALNSTTIPLAVFSGLVSALKGMSGALAKRVSMSPNPASSTTPMRIGMIASGELQPSVPALTTP